MEQSYEYIASTVADKVEKLIDAKLDDIIQRHLDNFICDSQQQGMKRQKRFKVTLPDGKEMWLQGQTISEAFVNGLQRMQQEHGDHTMTLTQFMDDVYFASFMESLAPTTRKSYSTYWNSYIKPYMGDKPLDTINVQTMQKFYDWLANGKRNGYSKNLNSKTIERISGLLGKVFHIAIDMQIIDKSPIKKTLLKNNGERAGHHKPLSRAEIDRVKCMIPNLNTERERMYMALLAYTGMRPQEILGMRWQHIHLDEGYCDMQRTVTYPTKSEPMVRDCGKTETSIRVVALPSASIDILRTCKDKTGYIIHGKTSSEPVCYSTYQRLFRSCFKQLEIYGKYTNYDFRTTYGTELCQAGLTTKQVADMMGHANTRMVQSVYARARYSGIMQNKNVLDAMNDRYREQ